MRSLRWILTVVLSCPLAGQTLASEPAREAVYLELAGNTGRYSLNYEHQFVNGMTLRAGIGTADFVDSPFCSSPCDRSKSDVSLYLIPLLINYLYSSGNHKLELGGGMLIGEEHRRNEDEMVEGVQFDAAATAVLGYRYQRPAAGLIFRAGFTPIYVNGELSSFVGISLGYAF